MFHNKSVVFDNCKDVRKIGNTILPYTYSDIEEELALSKTSAWISVNLMINSIHDVSGVESIKFFNEICINDFSRMGVNSIRHAILCNSDGYVLTDGVVLKLSEDNYRAFGLGPVLDYYLKETTYHVSGRDVSEEVFVIQVAGEMSKIILETAFEIDISDIKFARHKEYNVNGKKLRVLRLGVSGNLAYEIHGNMQDFEAVYTSIKNVGDKYNAGGIGYLAYTGFPHTEAGYATKNIHYPLPWFESDESLTQYLVANPKKSYMNQNRKLLGSVGQNLDSRFVTPFDLNLDFLMKFDDEYIGKTALEQMENQKKRTLVTLEWSSKDIEDILKVYSNDDKDYNVETLSYPSDFDHRGLSSADFEKYNVYRADKVYDDGKYIGITTGRVKNYFTSKVISLAFLEKEFVKEGKEITILWGTPGKIQHSIRAVIMKKPYLDTRFGRNETRDTKVKL